MTVGDIDEFVCMLRTILSNSCTFVHSSKSTSAHEK